MKLAKSASLVSALICGALLVSACVTHPPHHRGYGYGYAYHGHSHNLRYDNHLDVYLVVGRPHYYYHNDHYYRYHSGRWYSSRQLSGGWRDYDHRKLPRGLAKKYGRDNKRRRHS
jgi:hypothetical protein